MINLYVFNQTSPAAVFGIGTYIRELTTALKGSEINVCVVHLRSEKTDMEMEESDNIRHWYIPAQTSIHNYQNYEEQKECYYRNVLYLLQLYIVKRKEKLIFHINYMKCKPLVDLLKSTFDCKVVLVVHYLDSCILLMGNISRLRRIILQAIEPADIVERSAKVSFQEEKEMLQAVDKIICLANHTFDFLHQEYQIDKEKMIIIHNGLSEVITLRLTAKDLLEKWRLSVKEFLILFVGRLQSGKGLIFLIEAFRKMLEIIPNCRLIIAGNGDYDTYLQEAKDICTKITFTGLLEKKDLYEFYQIANVGVIPSMYETFGYVAVEMMMHGLPLVTTATSGLNEVVDDACGLKVPITILPDKAEINTTLLAQKILYLLQHPVEAQQMGQNGRKRFLKKYASEVFRKNMLDFYHTLK